MENEKHITGAVRDISDARDWQWSEIAKGLPPFDWDKGTDIEAKIAQAFGVPSFSLPSEDQGQSYSCGGQAERYYGEVLHAIFRKEFVRKSAKFPYAQVFAPGGGSAMRPLASVAIKQGWAAEVDCPSYQNGQAPTEQFMEAGIDITEQARIHAKLDMALNYATTGNDMDSVAQAIDCNYGAILGVTGQNNGTWRSVTPLAPSGIVGLWGHWLYAGKAKMINGIKHIGVLNSWGPNVGINGWQWLSESYFTTLIEGSPAIWVSWTHLFNTSPVNIAPPYDFLKDLSFGATDHDVSALQAFLQAKGYFPQTIKPTGYFGLITKNSLMRFQADNNIPAAGYFGPITRAIVNKMLLSA